MNILKHLHNRFSRAFCLCICCLSLFGISWTEIEPGEVEEEDKDIKAECEKYMVEVYDAFEERANKELGLVTVLTSGGSSRASGSRKVEMFQACYCIPKVPTIPEARNLEVKATELLLDIINKHEKLRPFLKEHPCPSRATSLHIYFQEGDSYSIVRQAGDVIYYEVLDSESQNPRTIAEEPYSEGRKIVLGN
jgi:hypothetical protein